jgi:hypothetical protein
MQLLVFGLELGSRPAAPLGRANLNRLNTV